MTLAKRPASFSELDLNPPATSGIDGITTLVDFAIITFAVNPADLSVHLPQGFEPEIFELHNGERTSLISAVTFREVDFYLKSFPWFKFAFDQINYRAYVLHKEQRAVWFFGNALATPMYFIPRYVWQMPWHYTKTNLQSKWQDGICESYEITATDPWGGVDVCLSGTAEPTGTLDGFMNNEDAEVILTHPLTAYYQRGDGQLGTYSIWHDRLTMQRAVVHKASFAFFQHLGLCSPDTKPHSALLLQRTNFIIQLPPGVVCS